MKNRVLRLAIVAVLVIAMVLSMAACGEKPTPTVAPTATPTAKPTVEPTVAPTAEPTVAPTPTPSTPVVEDDSVAAKKAFGIEVIAADSVYNGKENYVVITWNNDLLQNYKATTTYDVVDYDGITTVSIPVATLALDVDYDGENTYSFNQGNDVYAMHKDADGKWVANTADDDKVQGVAVKLTLAGTYTIASEYTLEDNGFYFGRFGAVKAEDSEYALENVVTIAKADVTLVGTSYVDDVNSSATAVFPSGNPTACTRANNEFTLFGADGKAVSDAMNTQFDADDDAYVYGIKFVEKINPSEVSEATLKLAIYEAGHLDNDHVVDLADVELKNFNVKITDGKQYFVSAYDWNVIRDTATSFAELGTTWTDASDIVTLGSNGVERVELAKARYDSLTDAQKLYFKTGKVGTDNEASIYYQGGIAKTEITASDVLDADNEVPQVVAGADNGALVSLGSELYTYMTESQKKVDADKVITAWEKAVEAANFDDYAAKTSKVLLEDTFNIQNASHIAAFNAVDSYYKTLSDDDKEALANTVNYVVPYKGAAQAFMMVDVNATKVLINAAVEGYNKALSDSSNIMYSNVGSKLPKTVVSFISSAEVKVLTAQARAAYDKLTADQKDLVKINMVETYNDVDDVDGLSGIELSNILPNSLDGVWDNAAELTFVEALEALEFMNSAVDYMNQIVAYTNIEDLADKASTSPAYASLKKIAFGTGSTYFAPADNSDIPATTLGVTSFAAAKRNGFYGTVDVIRALTQDKAEIDKVVAEYKAAIDYVLAAEAAKKTVVEAFDAAIAEEFVSGNDYTEAQLATALSKDNDEYKAIVVKITNEQSGEEYVTSTVQALLNTNVESYAEAIEGLADLYDTDDALDAYKTALGH